MDNSDIIKELGERELAKKQRKEKRDAEFFEWAMACIKDMNQRLLGMKVGDKMNVSWGPTKVHQNKDDSRKMPPDWETGKYKIEYNLRFFPAEKYNSWPERPQVGVYDFWPFLSTWEAKVFNRALKQSPIVLPQQTVLAVCYMDVRGCDGPTIWGPGMTPEQCTSSLGYFGGQCGYTAKGSL